MTIIVEDGSIVSGANSYITEAELTAHAAARGVTLTATEEILILKSMDFFEPHDDKFKGYRTTRDQPLSWPRSGAVIEGWSWSNDEIPRQVKSCILNLCLEISGGEDPLNASEDLPVIEKTVHGAVSVKYASPQSSKVSKIQQSKVILTTLLRNSGLFAVRA